MIALESSFIFFLKKTLLEKEAKKAGSTLHNSFLFKNFGYKILILNQLNKAFQTQHKSMRMQKKTREWYQIMQTQEK